MLRTIPIRSPGPSANRLKGPIAKLSNRVTASCRLMPQLYTLVHEAASNGTPIMRPLYYHYAQDEQASDVEDAFLVGENLLSAPIYKQGATSRQVYLPAGIWFDYW